MIPHTERAGHVALLGVVAAGAVAIASWIALDRDESHVTAGQATTTVGVSTTSTAPVPTASTAPTEPTSTIPPAPLTTIAMWPAPGSAMRFSSAAGVARSFAVDFLHFRAPLVGDLRRGDSQSGEVPIKPRARGPETTVLVRERAAGDWVVLGSTTADITVDAPLSLSRVSSPVTVTGLALAFEGTVQVEVREDGKAAATGAGFVTGGGDVPRPFTGAVAFEPPAAPYGAVVFVTTSAENGEVWQAVAIRVALVPGGAQGAACGTYQPQRLRPGPGQMEVTVFFSCDAEGAAEGALVAARRLVPASPRVLSASLAALLAGPTPDERRAGVGSWFSAGTASMLRSAAIVDGHAVIDFDDLPAVIPSASASSGSRRLLAELDATVFQFATVRSVEYRLRGSCTDFSEWLQFGGCDPRTRPVSRA